MVSPVGRTYCWFRQSGRGFSLARDRMAAKRTARVALSPSRRRQAGAVRLFHTHRVTQTVGPLCFEPPPNEWTPVVGSESQVAAAPNRIWLADITYIETDQGWLYLAAVMDLYSRRIVGWAMQGHMRTDLPLAALRMAISAQQPCAGLIHHSDRGAQYASVDYRGAVKFAGFQASIRPDGELLPHAQNRARPSPALCDTRTSQTRYLRLHRRLIQSNPAPFGHRVYQPDPDRAKTRLTVSTFLGEDQSPLHRDR
jgi:hypothetical protein